MKKHTRTIKKIVEIKRSSKVNPEENRYIDKRVREILKLQIPTVRKKLPDFLNPAEIYHIRKVAMDSSYFNRVLVDLLIFTGLRISEANNLLTTEIDRDNNQIKVVSGKGSKDRYVPISNNLIHQIDGLQGSKRGYVLAKSNGTKYTVRALQKKIEKILKICKFDKKLSTHSLRHTFACLCLSKGFSLEQIKLMMGHSSIKTTEIYAKLELGSIKQKYLQLMGD